LFNPNYDPAKHQVVVCDRCGRFVLESKFKMSSGQRCPRCNLHKMFVLKRFAATEHMAELIRTQGFELFRFIEGGLIKVD